MTYRLMITAIVLTAAVGIAAGCIDTETEQACLSDGDCQGMRICSGSGVCTWPEPGGDNSSDDAGSDGFAVGEEDAASDAGPDRERDTDARDTDARDADAAEGDADVGPTVECPEARPRVRKAHSPSTEWHDESIDVTPLDTIDLDASQSTGDITRLEWAIIARPQGSTQRLIPSNDVEQPTFFIDLAGDYIIELRVFFEADGRACSSAAMLVIRSCPCDSDVHIQLVWNTPADPDQTDTFGTDLDLHYLHENGRWNTAPWDIFFRNSTADWGHIGREDDPALDIDDTNGAGPENINHSGLENVSYRVGVHYYKDSTLGASYATMRIYTRGTLEMELTDRYMESTGAFWEVAEIQGADGSTTPIDRLYQSIPDP